MTTTECGAERPGPSPALCRKPAGHPGHHRGSYGEFIYNWERAKTQVRRIAIEFPARVLDETTDENLFNTIAAVVTTWESSIPGRDWDAHVYGTVIEVEDE